jgi:hypothetical protein
MSNPERARWEKFSALIESAETPEQRAVLEALKLQTEILQAELAQIRMSLAASTRGQSSVGR